MVFGRVSKNILGIRINVEYYSRHPNSTSSPKNVEQHFSQVPNDLSAYHFNYIIRKRIKLPETGSLYFFVNGKYLLKGILKQ
jgi:hypothetical protein